MSSNIKLVLFDCYGVCIKGGYQDTCKILAKRYKRNWKQLYDVMYVKYFNQAALKEITQNKAWEKAVQELSLPISAQELRKLHKGIFKTSVQMLKFANALKEQGYVIVLLSKNTRTQFIDLKKEHPKVVEAFGKNMINTWEYDLPKASKKMIHFICKRYNVLLEEIAYIDDQKENLKVAQELGVRIVLCRNVDQGIRDMKKFIN